MQVLAASLAAWMGRLSHGLEGRLSASVTGPYVGLADPVPHAGAGTIESGPSPFDNLDPVIQLTLKSLATAVDVPDTASWQNMRYNLQGPHCSHWGSLLKPPPPTSVAACLVS